MEIQSLSKDLTNDRVSMPYPHIKILEPSDAIALVLPALPEGDLPVLCVYNGVCRQLGSVRKSALIINQLSKISKLEYVKSAEYITSIKTPLDALEVLI